MVAHIDTYPVPFKILCCVPYSHTGLANKYCQTYKRYMPILNADGGQDLDLIVPDMVQEPGILATKSSPLTGVGLWTPCTFLDPYLQMPNFNPILTSNWMPAHILRRLK